MKNTQSSRNSLNDVYIHIDTCTFVYGIHQLTYPRSATAVSKSWNISGSVMASVLTTPPSLGRSTIPGLRRNGGREGGLGVRGGEGIGQVPESHSNLGTSLSEIVNEVFLFTRVYSHYSKKKVARCSQCHTYLGREREKIAMKQNEKMW